MFISNSKLISLKHDFNFDYFLIKIWVIIGFVFLKQCLGLWSRLGSYCNLYAVQSILMLEMHNFDVGNAQFQWYNVFLRASSSSFEGFTKQAGLSLISPQLIKKNCTSEQSFLPKVVPNPRPLR